MTDKGILHTRFATSLWRRPNGGGVPRCFEQEKTRSTTSPLAEEDLPCCDRQARHILPSQGHHTTAHMPNDASLCLLTTLKSEGRRVRKSCSCYAQPVVYVCHTASCCARCSPHRTEKPANLLFTLIYLDHKVSAASSSPSVINFAARSAQDQRLPSYNRDSQKLLGVLASQRAQHINPKNRA